MNLKRDNWTNEEVIQLLKGCRLEPIPNEMSDENLSLDMAIGLFRDMKCDSSIFSEAKAFDLDTERVVCVGPKLPQ